MASLPRRTALVVGGLLAGAALVACQVLAGLELPGYVEVSETGPVPEASTIDAGPLECQPRLPEARSSAPAADVTGATTFAVEFFQVPSSVKPDTERLCASYAVDLDGVETCAPSSLEDGGASSTANACRSRVEQCDTAGGGDSVLDQLAKDYFGQEPAAENDTNLQLQSGRIGFLIEISSYNWKADDGSVSVSLLASVGLALPDGGLPPGDGGAAAPPKHDGGDTFVPESSSLSDGQPLYKATRAYVTGDVLVARFGRGRFALGGATAYVEASEVVISAKIVHDAATGRPLRLDRGRVGLRVPLDTVASYVARRLSDGANVCGTGPFDVILRDRVSEALCNALDLSPAPGVGSPSDPCTSMSFSTAFYATAAARTEKGVIGPPQDEPVACPQDVPWPPKCEPNKP